MFFQKIDAAVQSVVDHCAFACMRRFDCGKSFIRYTLTAVFISASAGSLAVSLPVISSGWILLEGFLLVLWLAVIHTNYAMDTYAEKKGLLSPADAFWLRIADAFKVISIYAIVTTALLPFFAVGPSTYDKLAPAQGRFWLICEILDDAAFFLMAYLVRTPNTPPPVEERGRVLIPVPVRSR